MADKICFGRTEKFGIGIGFSAVQRRQFSHWVSVVREHQHAEPIRTSKWANIKAEMQLPLLTQGKEKG